MIKISFRVCIVLMTAILIIACSNFIFIGCGVQETTKQTNLVLSEIDSICISHYNMCDDDYKKMHIYIDEIKENYRYLDNMKKGIFDSNTITFLSSFVLVFLGGILFDIEKRTKERMVKTQEITKNLENKSKEIERWLEIELNQLKIDKHISTLVILKNHMQFQFSANDYQIDSGVVNVTFKLHDTLEIVLTLLENNKTRFLTDEAKKRI